MEFTENESPNDVRVRFAPSPTGYLHVGGARTALFDYLFARHNKGTFILRIEDTDRKRYDPAAMSEICESLRWMGLEWDEGPEVGGEYGPYVQSQRTELYKKYVEQLIGEGHAYRCFCSQERLQSVRAELQAKKKNYGYDRRCRDLSEDEIKTGLAEGRPYVVRLRVPLGRKVAFTDLIRDEIEYRTDILEDMVLMKSDGLPTYHLASVVDDHLMRISHVFRGEEWIASTPSHLLMYEAFGWQSPRFAHLPVILSPDGGKLSKRKGAASVLDFKRQGYLPEALFNFLALVGWNPGDEREKMSKEETVEAFTLDKVSPKAAVLDERKLEWMNGLYMAERSTESLLEEVVAGWRNRGVIEPDRSTGDPELKQIIELMKGRSKRITDLIEKNDYFFKDPEEYDSKAAKKHFKGDARRHLEGLIEQLEKVDTFDKEKLEEVYRRYAEEVEVSSGKLIHPTRLSVSGVSFGPGLFELLEALGKDAVLRRMRNAVLWLKQQE